MFTQHGRLIAATAPELSSGALQKLPAAWRKFAPIAASTTTHHAESERAQADQCQIGGPGSSIRPDLL